MRIGQYVLYLDPEGNVRDALVTGILYPDCVNLTYVDTATGQAVKVKAVCRQPVGQSYARPAFRSGLGDDLRFLRLVQRTPLFNNPGEGG